MTTVLTCIDGSAIASAVCDAAAWASIRMGAPLTLLHVLDKSDYAVERDLSGNIGLGSREHLLAELVVLDEKRGKLALEHGKLMLAAAQERVIGLGVAEMQTRQRHGELVETLLEYKDDTRLLVMGRLGEGHPVGAATIGSHLETVVRSVDRPILIAVQNFVPPTQFMIAFDASATAKKAVDMVAASPLLVGLPCHLVTAAPDDARGAQMTAAAHQLEDAGFVVTTALMEGDVQHALHDYQQKNSIDLMVMGAYGHSRIRQFFVGSNTTRMISRSDVSLLLLR